MITRIHVNQHKIKSDAKNGSRTPCLTVKTYKDNRRALEAVIVDESGTEVARVVYRPDAPLSCGARCWIETSYDVDVIV